MIIDCSKSENGYGPHMLAAFDVQGSTVYMNGEKMRDVMFADTQAGKLFVLDRDVQGQCRIEFSTGNLLMKELKGDVEIRFRKLP